MVVFSYLGVCLLSKILQVQLDLGYLATSYPDISIIPPQSCSVYCLLLFVVTIHSFPLKILFETNTKWLVFSRQSVLLAHLSRRLKVSYCDRFLSGVRRPSYVVRKLLYIFIFFSKVHGQISTKLCRNHP